jgi:aryl-alcohol dehydrogenase-like predicted oxidoreductase
MKLALGTVQFGLPYGVANQRGQISAQEAGAIIARARAAGVDTLDTAIGYGDAERTLGTIGVAGCRAVSKLPAIPAGCADLTAWVHDSVAGSLARLQIDSLYGLLLHQPNELLGPDGPRLFTALKDVQARGLVQKIGISTYLPRQLEAILSQFKLDLVQAPFSVLDRRLIGSGWLMRLEDQGVELHVRSVFLQGLLLMSPAARPSKFSRWAPLWARFDSWLAESALTPLQACLGYALSFPQIARVVVGVDGLRHLEEILAVQPLDHAKVPVDLGTEDLDLLDPLAWLRFT